MSAPFSYKSIFLWCYWDIYAGDTKKIAAELVAAGFEAAYVHTNNGIYEAAYSGRINCTPALVADLRAAGLKVYGWGAPYGSVAAEIAIMASQTRRYNLDGYVIDAESTWDAQPNAVANTKAIITGYQAACPGKPVAWCWWTMYQSPATGSAWHPVAVLREAMRFADVGMPMAYWSWGDSAADVIRYLNETYKQWSVISARPIIPAGRAFVDQYGAAPRAAVLAFDQRARELGAPGITWWDMQHAVRLPDCWQALTETKKFNGEVEMADWKLNAIMLYTKTATWSNTGFNAIIGHAGQGWDVPNPDLKPIETKAAAEGKPFLALWDFDVDYYSVNQFMGDDTHWPSLQDDYPLQMLIRALTSRDPKAVIVRVMTEKNHAGKTEDPGYIAYAADRFMGRVGDWLAANKPKAKLMIGTNNDFITRFAPNMNNWAYEYPSFIIQTAVLPLDLSFPQPADKVKNYISVRPTWEMWHYYDTAALDLVLYNGTKDQLYAWLEFGAAPADTQPPTVPTGLTAQVSGDKITLTWQPSTDNVGVTGYHMYDGYGVLFAQTTITSWSVSGKLPGTYIYGVSALDAAGNESGKAVVSVTVPDIEEPVNLAELLALTKENNALLKEIRAVFK